MKKFLIGLAAAAAVLTAVPAMAHDHDEDGDGWRVDSYNELVSMDQHIRDGIRHGLSDGSFSRSEARYFYRQLQSIEYRARWEESRGDFDEDEISDRLQNLHDRMHQAHEDGHERLNDDWNYRW